MNTRSAIQPASTSVVLDLALSPSRNRFVAALSDGIRVFRTDSCMTTAQPTLPSAGGIAVAAVLDDRYIAFAAGGRTSAGSPNVVIFWDCLLDQEVTRFNFYEAVLGLRLNGRCMVVILEERAVVLEYQELSAPQQPSPPADDEDDIRTEKDERESDSEGTSIKAPNKITAIHATSLNSNAVASLGKDTLVLPAQSVGQIQLVPLARGSKRVFRAHNTSLRRTALSPAGDLLATSSEQGTLIRVFDATTLDQVAEFRRGVEKAVVYGMAFSDSARWLAVTSDKGTLHVFDLRPTSSATTDARSPASTKSAHGQPHRKSQSNPVHRLSGGGLEKESLSGRSSPSTVTTAHQGSIQEYYGLRPPPASASPSGREAAATAISAFKSSSLAPRIFKDARSVASAPFYVGNDPPHWQGGAGHSWTTAPDGTRKRVRHPVSPLPADPTGRPPKGVVTFISRSGITDDDGAVFYVLGGGSDARWEMFEIVPVQGSGAGGWGLANRGFRRYLTRQFVD